MRPALTTLSVSRPFAPAWLIAIAALAVVGCSDTTPNKGGPGIDGTNFPTQDGEDTDATPDADPKDTSGPSDAFDDTQIGEPCTSNIDCDSGFCVEGADGYVCTETCFDDCPTGWNCKGVQSGSRDVVFLCVPDFAERCTPCAEDFQCGGGACLALDGQTRCAPACKANEDCPTGYDCVADAAGEHEGLWCQPRTGSCSCFSAFDGGQRTCSAPGPEGICDGVQACDPAVGWGACSAAPAVEELCDYADNDCDGQVDEDFREDGIYGTFAHCGACGLSCAGWIPNASVTECDTSGPAPRCVVVACQAGFVQLNDVQCIATGASLCQPCDSDDSCLGEGAKCLTLTDGSFCGQVCADGSECPEGYACESAGSGAKQCVPTSNSCSCNVPNDGFSRACAVSWQSPNPAEPSYTCPGTETCGTTGWSDCAAPEEVCDGLDNNCDGAVDEGYKNGSGQYLDVDHCGGCNLSCLVISLPHAEPTCVAGVGAPQCDYGCLGGWMDVNGLADDGCECLPIPGSDFPDALGIDSDCDGIDGERDAAIFVSKAGDDDNFGDLDSPMRTIQGAIEVASTWGYRDVYVATGVFEESVVLADGVNVYGGYSATFEVRDPILYQTAILGASPTFEAPGAVNAISVGFGSSPTTFDGFSVFGTDAATPGASSYAVVLRNVGSELLISNNVIVAGSGAAGANGAAGSSGGNGATGSNGVAAADAGSKTCSASSEAAGGAGGVKSCGGTSTNGGAGGTRICPDAPASVQSTSQTPEAEEWGMSGANGGGDGGEPGWDDLWGATSCNICSSNSGHASDGADGLGGGTGAEGNAAGKCSFGNGLVDASGSWVPHGGGGGGAGAHGSGGGGGGAGGGVDMKSTCSYNKAVGGAGGGGGSGGCGATGGLGGSGGGGSFGIFATWSTAPSGLPTVAGNTVYRGLGGTGGGGGQGGIGGSGGVGGAGGGSGQGTGGYPITICGSGGGYGGAGGGGGHGAGGAGGCGGVSYGVYIFGKGVGTPTVSMGSNTFPVSGTAGSGGVGGSSFGASGVGGGPGAHAATNF